MKLIKLHIENFGKLHNIDLNFNSFINELLQENGWGKSTLSIFIKSMFYSMPAKTRGDEYKSERTKFLPWQGGIYGGFIEYEIDNKRYRVTRTFGKSPEYDTFELFDFSRNLAIKQEDKNIGEEIFGIGEESFKMTAFFPQVNFKSTSNPELTANLTGVNKYQDDLENIDKAIKKLKEKRLEIKRQIPKKSDIEEKKILLNQIKSRENSITKEIEDNENELSIAKNSKVVLDKSVEIEKEKLSIQENKFKDKSQIENRIKDLTSKVANLYEKQNNIKDQTLENLNSKNKNNIILTSIIVLLSLLATTSIVLYFVNIFNLKIFISILVICIFSIIILSIFKYLKYKKDKKLNSNINSSLDIANNFKIQIDELNCTLKKLENMLDENYRNIDMPKREEYENIKNKQSILNMSIYSFENKITNLKNELENNLSQGDYLSSQIELMKQQYNKLTEKTELIEKTIEYLLKARDNVASRYVSSINGEFSTILSKFGIDIERFVIDNQWNVKEQTTIGTKDFEYSSQGLQDIISFCQRISLINKIYKKEKPFVILDDTFVNLDDKMLDCAKQVVKELAGELQVIYICCHSRCSILQ